MEMENFLSAKSNLEELWNHHFSLFQGTYNPPILNNDHTNELIEMLHKILIFSMFSFDQIIKDDPGSDNCIRYTYFGYSFSIENTESYSSIDLLTSTFFNQPDLKLDLNSNRRIIQKNNFVYDLTVSDQNEIALYRAPLPLVKFLENGEMDDQAFKIEGHDNLINDIKTKYQQTVFSHKKWKEFIKRRSSTQSKGSESSRGSESNPRQKLKPAPADP